MMAPTCATAAIGHSTAALASTPTHGREISSNRARTIGTGARVLLIGSFEIRDRARSPASSVVLDTALLLLCAGPRVLLASKRRGRYARGICLAFDEKIDCASGAPAPPQRMEISHG